MAEHLQLPAVTTKAVRAPQLGLEALKTVASLLSPLLLVVIWQALCSTHFFPAQILIPPLTVAHTFTDLWRTGDLIQDIKASGVRLMWGVSIGSIAGLAFGLALGLIRSFERLFALTFHILRQVPTIAWIPLLILVLGLQESFKISIVAMAAFFPVALNTWDGIRDVPVELRELGTVFQLNYVSLLSKIILPSALPSIVTGVRLGLNRAWVLLIAAELLASDAGFGYLMDWGRQLFQLDIVMVGVILTGLIGLMLDQAFRYLERLFSSWRAPVAGRYRFS